MTFIKIWDIDMLLPTAFDFIRYDGIWELGNRTDRVGWRIGYEARGRRCQGRKHQKKKKNENTKRFAWEDPDSGFRCAEL